MNKKRAYQVAQEKLSELLSSDNLREWVTQLLEKEKKEEQGYIRKRDLMEYVDKEENGEIVLVPRGGGSLYLVTIGTNLKSLHISSQLELLIVKRQRN